MTTYRDAGVDLDEADRFVGLIEPLARSTARPEVLGTLGGFGGLFALPPGKYREPVLVAGADGVGTKLELARQAGRLRGIGIDLVAMNVDDVAARGAEPLFFLDYLATARLRAEEAAELVAGISEGCRIAGCALLGGETAELPGLVAAGSYELAGFAVGVVERSRLLGASRVRPGDAILGLASCGLHANGFALVRRILERRGASLDERPEELGVPLGEALLAPTRIYAPALLALCSELEAHAFAHVTGGGLPRNLRRVLPAGCRALVRKASWPRPALFELLGRWGEVPEDELFRTFNMGLGLAAIVRRDEAAAALGLLARLGVEAWQIGEVLPGGGAAEVELI